MFTNNPKISVIVPVYNVEEYLPKCIDSILDQSYSDFELLLIDDGSNDNSGVICDDYAKKDIRIRVFHKKNGGVSSARNMGLDNILGDYICFADSDDYVGQNYLYDMFSENEGYDFIVSGLCNEYVQNETSDIQYPSECVCADRSAIGKILPTLEKKRLMSGVNSKLFKRNIIEETKQRFDEEFSYGEDILFVLRYIENIFNMITVKSAEYYYMHRNVVSLSKKRYSYEIESNWCQAMFHLYKIIILKFNIQDKVFIRFVDSLFLNYFLSAIYSMYHDEVGKKKNERKKIIKHIIKEKQLADFDIFFNKTPMSIISLILFKIANPTLIDIIYKIIFKTMFYR
jgi:glycosyltransferase involved in cell wall biosynthesis